MLFLLFGTDFGVAVMLPFYVLNIKIPSAKFGKVTLYSVVIVLMNNTRVFLSDATSTGKCSFRFSKTR
ncbi:MAG: hypothetical protein EB166_03080 [Thaumarchaeota archaeon]|nr:hypothetical protein [Nitrososphaerota archaeon]NDF26213.1 hypothetical protein [Nitrosopumilaceae archaeon]